MKWKLGISMLALVAWALAVPAAHADHGGCCCSMFGNAFGAPFGGYTSERIPYYALHPPVYYSHVVPRPYGYSPWAYPPGTMEPTPAPQPQTYINPYVPQDEPAEKKTEEQTARTTRAKRVLNPFVDQVEIELTSTDSQ